MPTTRNEGTACRGSRAGSGTSQRFFERAEREGIVFSRGAAKDNDTSEAHPFLLSFRRRAARKAIEYAVKIAQGLAAAHEKGIVHRDLKPESIFVTRDGRVWKDKIPTHFFEGRSHYESRI